MKKIKRTTVLLILAMILMLSLFPVSVFAIDDPDSPTVIRSAFAYRHCLEENDWLIFIDYFIDYPIIGIPTDYTVTESYIATLLALDGVTAIKSAAPYTFVYTGYTYKGYRRGMVSIYLTAAEASTLLWGEAYTVEIAGNPLLTWPTDPPSTTAAIDPWSSSSGIGITRGEIATQVLSFAQALTTSWVITMTEPLAGGTVLTTAGEIYFTGVITPLREMAPSAFSISTTAPEFEDRVPTTAWATTLAAIPIGTPLDMTNLAAAIGTSRMWVSTGLFFIVLLTFLYFVVRAMGVKLALPISGVAIIAAGAMGFIPLALTIGIGVLALLISGMILFYNKSSA